MSKVGSIWIQEGKTGAALKIKFRLGGPRPLGGGEYEYRAYPNKFKKAKWDPDFIIYSRDELPERDPSGKD